MALWRPDPTFYPSPGLAMQAPPEKLGYVVMLNPQANGKPDALAVVDLDPGSTGYGHIVSQLDMPNAGDELHHFGWNACSACLCPYAPHPHVERRYLIVPGLRSSRIHIVDTKPDPAHPKIVKVIEPETLAARTGYASPHTIHCGPEGILASAIGSAAPAATVPAEFLSSITTASMCSANGNWIEDRSILPMTFGGILDSMPRSPANGEPPIWFRMESIRRSF